MSHMRLWTSAAIITVIIFVSFVLSVPHTRDLPRPQMQQEKIIEIVPTVTIHDVFKKGVHTITGSILAPTPCTSVTASAELVGTASSTDSILVIITMPKDTGVCLQEPARLNFSTTINASASLPIHATVNGMSATTTRS